MIIIRISENLISITSYLIRLLSQKYQNCHQNYQLIRRLSQKYQNRHQKYLIRRLSQKFWNCYPNPQLIRLQLQIPLICNYSGYLN